MTSSWGGGTNMHESSLYIVTFWLTGTPLYDVIGGTPTHECCQMTSSHPRKYDSSLFTGNELPMTSGVTKYTLCSNPPFSYYLPIPAKIGKRYFYGLYLYLLMRLSFQSSWRLTEVYINRSYGAQLHLSNMNANCYATYCELLKEVPSKTERTSGKRRLI